MNVIRFDGLQGGINTSDDGATDERLVLVAKFCADMQISADFVVTLVSGIETIAEVSAQLDRLRNLDFKFLNALRLVSEISERPNFREIRLVPDILDHSDLVQS